MRGRAPDRRKIMILGGGPNRIGQGIEFDYCCVHAALALREDGFETIMVNCNPETVSTDYDTSDRLYFEPLTLEDVLEIIAKEKPEGVIVQFGGQTPLKLSRALEEAGAPSSAPGRIRSTSPRIGSASGAGQQFGLKQPANATARNEDQAVVLAREVGFPLVVRPSYVLGGRAMEVVFTEEDLVPTWAMRCRSPTTARYCSIAFSTCDRGRRRCRVRWREVLIGGIMEHVEQAGVHSGDRAARLPPNSLSAEIQESIRDQTRKLAQGVLGRGSDEHPICGAERRRCTSWKPIRAPRGRYPSSPRPRGWRLRRSRHGS